MGKKQIIELPHIYRAREYQKGFWGAMHKEGKKRALCVWHRRAGKDLTALNWTIVASQLRVGVYYHLLPYQNQASKILWDGIDGNGNRFLDYWPVGLIRRVDNTDMMLELKNGSIWQLVGTDNKDRLMGTNPVGVVLSEYSLQDPEAWEYIRPILSENGGWAVFLYTPRGRNHAYDLHMMVKDNPDWFTSVLTVEDTGAVSQEAIAAEVAAGMEEELVNQEYYVSYTAPRFGAYYGRWMEEARKEKRIGNVSYDPALATHTFWDLGVDDYTAIWFVQMAGQEIHLVDYYEMSGEGLAHYARVLKEKAKENDLVYGEHWAPHDIEARELGLGRSRRDTARDLGIRFQVVRLSSYKRQGGPLFVTEGIESVRKILHRCWFDEGRCSMGIKRLEQYRREWDNKLNSFRSSPLHDENCLTGDTKVLTRYGIHPIMNLPNTGEVQTSCGWKPYHSPRITRRNAPLVEVAFKDGLTVRCTPDHPFLTESGWRYAELLIPGTLIQSSLTQSPNISMGVCTDYIRSIVVKDADTLTIESVKKLDLREDVWCLSVPDGNAFSLENSAIVHNSHGADAFRTMAMGMKLGAGGENTLAGKKEDRYGPRRKKSESSAWSA